MHMGTNINYNQIQWLSTQRSSNLIQINLIQIISTFASVLFHFHEMKNLEKLEVEKKNRKTLIVTNMRLLVK